jgi:hypothetical protein
MVRRQNCTEAHTDQCAADSTCEHDQADYDGIYDYESLRLAVRKYRELFGPKLKMPVNHALCFSFTVVNRALWERAAMVAEPHFPPL